MPRIFTIGHSNHPIETFLGMLRTNNITHVIDVRSSPKSRFCPQFNRAALEASITGAELMYFYRGDKLGGYTPFGPESASTLAHFLTWAESNSVRPALMCAEKNPPECHRDTKLTNWILRSSTFDVEHIMPGGQNYLASRVGLPPLDQGFLPYSWLVEGRSVGFPSREAAVAIPPLDTKSARVYNLRVRA